MTLHYCCWLHDTIVLITCVHCTIIIKRIDFYSTDLKQIIQETTRQDILNLDFSCTVKRQQHTSLETENFSLAQKEKREKGCQPCNTCAHWVQKEKELADSCAHIEGVEGLFEAVELG